MQCTKDGKSFIMEGLHLEPGMYLYEFGRQGVRDQPASVPYSDQSSGADSGAPSLQPVTSAPGAEAPDTVSEAPSAVADAPQRAAVTSGQHSGSAPSLAVTEAAAAAAAAPTIPAGEPPLHESHSAPQAHHGGQLERGPLLQQPESTRQRLKQRLRRLGSL